MRNLADAYLYNFICGYKSIVKTLIFLELAEKPEVFLITVSRQILWNVHIDPQSQFPIYFRA
jgi:hypothetical protein